MKNGPAITWSRSLPGPFLIIVAGGCNFPDTPAADGGQKVFYNQVFILEQPLQNGQWTEVGMLPKPLAYGASVTVPEGVVCIGGTTDGQSSESQVWLLSLAVGHKLVCKELPALPVGLDNMAAAYGAGYIWVAGGSSKGIPSRIRIIVQLVVVAALVTLVSEVLKAFAYDVAMQLSVYIGLIITNCILMGRLEAFAMSNGPWDSLLDGLGNGLGYAIILVIVAFFRELLGSGTLLGFQVIPQWCYEHGYVNNGMMMMPAMALILVGCIIWVHRSINKEEKK